MALAIEAQSLLSQEGVDVAVVSMPCQELFDQQSKDYQESILPRGINHRMSIEMGASFGWHKYVGLEGVTYAIDRFGQSGPGQVVVEDFGFTASQIAQAYLKAFA